MIQWDFYGRRTELAQIEELLRRNSFFFCSISGRRRIGKTSLIQQALSTQKQGARALYVQIPDSDERGVIQVFEDSIEDTLLDQEFARKACGSFSDIAILLRVLWKANYVTAIDEFQYFHRKTLEPFLSHLQSSVDRTREQDSRGGLFTLGSIHTEMTAVLEDKSSPLFNRVTHRIHVGHWDFETLFEMFRAHAISDPAHRLFLWSIFEGVPKFYRDCFDGRILTPSPDYRAQTLRRMFFDGASPLKDEAENWFLRELRGKYDSVLKLIAKAGPCSHGRLQEEYDRTGPGNASQLGAYLKVLIEKYQIIEKANPIFAAPKSRKARYRITDNFLNAWLSSIERSVHLARIRPIDESVERSSQYLETHEGYAFEKMIRLLTEECSRKGVGDFSATELVKGYWNKADGSDIEIDLIALNATEQIIRFGSCKRAATRHDSSALYLFENHIKRFLQTKEGRRFTDWTVERVLYSPQFDEPQHKALSEKGYICLDLPTFETWLEQAAHV